MYSDLHTVLLWLHVQMSFCDSNLTAWQWLRSQPLDETADADQRVQKDSTDGYSTIEGAVGRVYTPVEADEGCRLMVQCTPKSR